METCFHPQSAAVLRLFVPFFALFSLAALAQDDAPAPQPPPSEITLLLPERGPVAISLRHELDHAYDIAARWLADQPRPSAPLPSPAAYWTDAPLRTAADASPLLGLLGGWPLPDNAPPRYQAAAALAYALDQIGEEWVFLAPDAPPIDWRKALVRQLLVEQRVTPKGTGYWPPPPADTSPDATTLSTLSALQALALASSLPPPPIRFRPADAP